MTIKIEFEPKTRIRFATLTSHYLPYPKKPTIDQKHSTVYTREDGNTVNIKIIPEGDKGCTLIADEDLPSDPTLDTIHRASIKFGSGPIHQLVPNIRTQILFQGREQKYNHTLHATWTPRSIIGSIPHTSRHK